MSESKRRGTIVVTSGEVFALAYGNVIGAVTYAIGGVWGVGLSVAVLALAGYAIARVVARYERARK